MSAENLFTHFILFALSYNSVVMSYNPAADSTIATPGKKRKRSEENGETAPGHSVPVTPSTTATEEGLCPIFWIRKNLEHKENTNLYNFACILIESTMIELEKNKWKKTSELF